MGRPVSCKINLRGMGESRVGGIGEGRGAKRGGGGETSLKIRVGRGGGV